MTDPLDRLAAAGFPLEHLGPDERDVLGALSAPELDLLVELKQRLDEVGPEVQAHSEIAGGALF